MFLKSFQKDNRNFRIFLILLLGFVIRFAYLVWGADFYLGERKYIMGDTSGWVNSFLNLLNHGTYSFDLNNPDAAFGRVPGFSFFWGIHYLLFKDYAFQAVAITQLLLDTIAIFLVFKISFNLYKNKNIALIASFLYATYPFIIAWITVSYSELLSNFVIILTFYFVTKSGKKKTDYILIGLFCAFGFFVREFSGILLPITVFTVLFVEKAQLNLKLKNSSLIVISFLSLYSFWPLRNYINHNRIVLARTMGGFERYNHDFLSFRTWVNSWDPDEGKWVNAVASSNKPVAFPNGIFQNQAEKDKAAQLVSLLRSCGTSIQHWKGDYNLKPNLGKNCNKVIASGFESLTSSYIKNNTATYLSYVPFKNLKKAVFKNELFSGSVVKSKTQHIMSLLFLYRSVLIILGFIGIILCFKIRMIYPLAAFSLFMYLFLSFVIRFLEMRNLIQADTILLIPAAFTIFKILMLFRKLIKTST